MAGEKLLRLKRRASSTVTGHKCGASVLRSAKLCSKFLGQLGMGSGATGMVCNARDLDFYSNILESIQHQDVQRLRNPRKSIYRIHTMEQWHILSSHSSH